MPFGEYELENKEITALLRKLAERIGEEMPEGWGFTLLLFEYSPKNSLFYISSAKRADIIKTMREFIQRNQ